MNEGKRIEGQMFMKGGVGWTLGVLLLLVAVGFTFLVGYAINRWSGLSSSFGVRAMGGGGVTGTGTGVLGGTTTTWTGPMAGLPVQGQVPVDTVQWPVAAGGTFREHWEGKQPGTGTLNMWYMDPASKQGWQWGSAISIPVKGENTYVIVVNLPRGFDPPDAPGGQIWVCELGRAPNGDIMPFESSVRVRAQLTAAQVKSLWENDFPPGLAQDLIDAGNGKGPLAAQTGTAAQVQQYQAFVPIEKYFKVPDNTELSEIEEPE